MRNINYTVLSRIQYQNQKKSKKTTTPLNLFAIFITMEFEDILYHEDLSVTSETLSLTAGTDIELVVQQVLQGNWVNISLPLSSWQMSQLDGLQSASGIRCLITMWFGSQRDLMQGSYCNATWDSHYCWPPTPTNTIVTRPCSETFLESHPTFAEYIEGTASRVCQGNGTWLKGNWTNYTECADNYEAYVAKTKEQEQFFLYLCQYMLFIGSIFSVLSLSTALAIFYYFKCLWCDRITVLVHLMVALLLRFTLLFIITEPVISSRSSNYRDVDLLCKAILVVYLYSTMATVGWMFIQGVYLNSKLTTSVFSSGTPFKIYYFIGWVIPLMLILIYVITMTIDHTNLSCWKGYSEMDEIWIVIGPILAALVLNLIFLLNILRILREKVQNTLATTSGSDLSQFRTAAKATIILFPVLGINNLLFLYVPGDAYEKYYVFLNTFFSSSQGVFVALVYCFFNHDVHEAIRRSYNRFKLRRGDNTSTFVNAPRTNGVRYGVRDGIMLMVEIIPHIEETQSVEV